MNQREAAADEGSGAGAEDVAPAVRVRRKGFRKVVHDLRYRARASWQAIRQAMVQQVPAEAKFWPNSLRTFGGKTS